MTAIPEGNHAPEADIAGLSARSVTTDKRRLEVEIEQDIAALRKLPTGGDAVSTLVGVYAMQGETTRGEPRWHSLMFSGSGRGWVTPHDTPDSGRAAAVRSFAVKHYRAELERQGLI